MTTPAELARDADERGDAIVAPLAEAFGEPARDDRRRFAGALRDGRSLEVPAD